MEASALTSLFQRIQHFRLSLTCLFFNEAFPISYPFVFYALSIFHPDLLQYTSLFMHWPIYQFLRQIYLRAYSVRHSTWYRLSARSNPGPGLLETKRKESWNKQTKKHKYTIKSEMITAMEKNFRCWWCVCFQASHECH